jgi:hypothetical protein
MTVTEGQIRFLVGGRGGGGGGGEDCPPSYIVETAMS